MRYCPMLCTTHHVKFLVDLTYVGENCFWFLISDISNHIDICNHVCFYSLGFSPLHRSPLPSEQEHIHTLDESEGILDIPMLNV